MNVFVLCVGRCGSVTFAKACSHIENFTASHESRCKEIGVKRLAYPENHIEVDNRLAWFLGRLEEKYGDSAVYVYLRRNPEEIASSYNKRWANDLGIMSAFAKGVLQSRRVGLDVARDLVNTVSENIQFFLRDKSQVFIIDIEDPEQEFIRLWRHIGAEGDLAQAVGEFRVRHNSNIFVKDASISSDDGETFVLRQLEEWRDKLQQQKAELQSENRKLRGEYSQLQKKISQLQIQNGAARIASDSPPHPSTDLQGENRELKNRCDRLQLALQKAETDRQLSSQQIKTLQTQLQNVRSSVSFRLGNAITRNVKTPKGWLKFPREIWRAVARSKTSKPLGIERAPRAMKHVIWNASELAHKEGWDGALAFAAEHAAGHERNSLHLLRANMTLTDASWLEALNAYLKANNAGCGVALQPGEGARFHRLVSVDNHHGKPGPLVSVIMPAFNAEKTLRLSASSILNQTHGNLELIIVDDCSSDSTYAIACELAEVDSRVKVLRNPVNVGPYVSKNLALRIAAGKYITGHDADDWALPNRLSRDLELVNQSGGRIRASLSSMLRMHESGAILHFSKVGLTSTDGANRVASISLFIEASVVHEVLGGWDSVRFGADSEFIARARHYLQDAFMQTDRVGMLCLDHAASLTNHATHGVDRVRGISPVRRDYRDAWQSWHQNLPLEGYRLEFPLSKRPFKAPEVMQVPPKAVNACLAEAPFTTH